MSMENGNGKRPPHPFRNDPLEQRIRGLIRDNVCSTVKGREMFAKVNDLQIDYFRDAIGNIGKPGVTHDRTQELLKELSQVTNSRIVQGAENLDSLPKKSPVFAMVNHFSGYKLVAIEQGTLGVDSPDIDQIYPFPIFYSSLVPVAEALEDNLYDAHLELPAPLLKVQEEAGLLVVPPGEGQFKTVVERTEDHLKEHPNSLLVLFPEGESSGKRNNGGPYDMVGFHAGSFIIAAKKGIPVVPIAQYFNPNSGFELAIFPSFKLDPNGDRAYFEQMAANTRQEMQAWLDTKK